MHPAIQAAATIALALGAALAYFRAANRGLDLLLPLRGPRAGANLARASRIRPWLFLAPALAAMALYLVWPVLATAWLSLHDRSGEAFVGLANYRALAADPKFAEALRNTLLWLLVAPAAATAIGLAAAEITDRIAWGAVARALIFMPMAISFVGAAVIWKLVYDARPPGQEQVGILNALVLAAGGEPRQWLQIPLWNNFFLMAVLVWIQTGFAMVILAAALRGVPGETIEAAVLDGAGPWRLFLAIKLPQIRGAIVVVWTTITLTVLKVFDIVLAMTNGEWDTQVLANYVFARLFRSGGGDWGAGSAAAMAIMVLVTPILLWNLAAARRAGRR